MTTKEQAGLLELTRKRYSDQAIWFLNGFWTEGAEAEAENIWKFTEGFVSLDTRKKEGNELDEFWSHKFLESLGETLTVINLRDKLRKIDLDANGKMSLLEYLMFKYSKQIPQVLNAPQGDNTEEIEKAQKEFRAVQEALDDVQRQLEQQKKAKDEVHRKHQEQKQKVTEQNQKIEEQNRKLEEQKNRLSEQKKAEEEVRKSEEEQAIAVNDLRNQENALQETIRELTQKSENGDSIVAKNKAKQELAQLKQENPLPLRKAKITAEAALRKVEKQRKEAEVATGKAVIIAEQLAAVAKELESTARQLEVVARQLEGAKKEAEEATKRVEHAVRDTEARMAEAEAYLEEVKKKPGRAFGAIWWIERELKEAKKYLPQRKQ